MTSDLRDRLLVVFDVGQLLNQHRWHLMHYAMLNLHEHKQPWRDVLAKLAGEAIEFTSAIGAGKQLHEMIVAWSTGWQTTFASADYEDKYVNAHKWLDLDRQYDNLNEPQSPSVGDAFEEIIGQADKMHARIRGAFEREVSEFDLPDAAFHLGEAVDEGLRPPEVELHLYEHEINPAWQTFIEQQPKLTAADVLAVPRVHPGRVRVQGPAAPPQFIWVGHSREACELPPPFGWPQKIESLWGRLGLDLALSDIPLLDANREKRSVASEISAAQIAMDELVKISRNGLLSLSADKSGRETCTRDSKSSNSPPGVTSPAGDAAVGFTEATKTMSQHAHRKTKPRRRKAKKKSLTEPAVSNFGTMILKTLHANLPTLMSIEAICGVLQGKLSERTVGPEITRLIKAEFVVRPQGLRKGATLTDAGKDLAKKFINSK
jgi:hypothetical protein